MTSTAATAETSAPVAHYVSAQGDMHCNKFHVDVQGASPRTHATERNPGPNPDAAHAWERAGLGVAPYRLIGSGAWTYQACPDAPIQPGGSCDYCGQGITNVYFIRAACGSTFHVGCDCVHKVCSKAEGVLSQVVKVERKRAAAKRAAADSAKTAEVDRLIEEHRERLRGMPHPRGFEGQTMLDDVEWRRKNCGAKGRAALLKQIRAAVK